MAKISIIGGHGKIALRLAPLLVDAGHEVSSWIRSESQVPDIEATGATAAVLDIERADVPTMAHQLRDCDVLVWSAGAGGGEASRTYAVDRDAAIRSIQAAAQIEVSRYIMVSYFGSSVNHGVPEDDPFHSYAEAKAAADAHLAGSGQPHTILGPSRLTDDAGTGKIEIPAGTDTGETKHEVTRDDVAGVIATIVQLWGESPNALLDRTIEFNNGSVEILQALRGV